MSEEIEYSRDFADRIYRESLKKPENLRDLVSAVLPEIAGGFVFERAELLDREFPWDFGNPADDGSGGRISKNAAEVLERQKRSGGDF